jgi:hypothetical protein
VIEVSEREKIMRYLSEDEAARMMGLGYIGEVYQGLDGHLYEWVEGVDEWGDPIGFLQGLSEPEVAELSGLGALYQAPDGTLYQMQGLAEEEKPMEAMGPRAQGQRRLPGRRPQRPGPGFKGGAPRKKGGFLKKLLPIAKFATRFIPGIGPVVSAGVDVASKLVKPKGAAGYAGLGALYAAPDGTVYQVQGLAEEDLDGLYADEELGGFAEDEELRGFAEDEELRGFAEDEELRGFAEDEELRGLDEDDELRGLEQGYVREDAVSGLEAYLPAKPPQTRWFAAPSEPPELWRPLW